MGGQLVKAECLADPHLPAPRRATQHAHPVDGGRSRGRDLGLEELPPDEAGLDAGAATALLSPYHPASCRFDRRIHSCLPGSSLGAGRVEPVRERATLTPAAAGLFRSVQDDRLITELGDRGTT